MPFIDFNDITTQNELQLERFDYTIIGCGAVGIHAALLLAQKAKSVLILETGSNGERPDRQVLNEVTTNRTDIKSSMQWGRKRALGGTTIRWGGQALPFSPLDFGDRPWTKGLPWPIAYQALEPHYREAEKYMGIRTHGYYKNALAGLGLEVPFKSQSLEYHVSKWAPEPNMFSRHRQALKQHTTVLFNAHCTAIEQTNEGTCNQLTIQSFNGHVSTIPINNLILAAGGAETTRLIMLNNLSNSPSLGKGFMEHPCMDLGTVNAMKPKWLQSHFSTHMIRKQKYGIRLSFTESIQKQHQLTNASASLMFETPEAIFDPLRSLQALSKEKSRSALLYVLKHLPHYLKSAQMFVKHGIVWKPHAAIRITVMCEQLASDGSTLELDQSSRDVFGLPKLKVNWRISDATWQAAKFMASEIKEFLEAQCHSKVELREEFTDKTTSFDPNIFSSVNHHMGGTVMGENAETSVVNADLKIHGMKNVWVCSASVFPTGSHSNPTLTALALAGQMVQAETSIKV